MSDFRAQFRSKLPFTEYNYFYIQENGLAIAKSDSRVNRPRSNTTISLLNFQLR